MPALFQRIENQQPEHRRIHFILDKSVRRRNFGKLLAERSSQIVIAHAHVDRERHHGQGVFETAITLLIAAIHEITGRQQQVGLRFHGTYRLDRLIKPLAVELSRIIGVETQMNIRDLRHQHGRSPFSSIELLTGNLLFQLGLFVFLFFLDQPGRAIVSVIVMAHSAS